MTHQGTPTDVPAEAVLDLAFELGQLKRLRRSGWLRAGIDDPETVAGHSLRTAQLAFMLAVLEDHPDPSRVAALAVFHDMAETRTGDLDRIAKHYVNGDEPGAVDDQTSPLGPLGEAIRALWYEAHDRREDAALLCKDADLLELMLTGKEYLETGHPAAQHWIDTARQGLMTEAAKTLATALETRSFTEWWQGFGRAP